MSLPEEFKIPELVAEAKYAIGVWQNEDGISLSFLMMEHPRHGKLFFLMSIGSLRLLANGIEQHLNQGKKSTYGSN